MSVRVICDIALHQEKQELLQQLQALEREDRTLRQKALATMPVSASVYIAVGVLYMLHNSEGLL